MKPLTLASRSIVGIVLTLPCALLLTCPLTLSSQSQNTSFTSEQASALALPARTWAAETASNEVQIIEHPGSYLRYRMHVIDDKADQVRDTIETRDGTVARAIMRNGRPLTPDEDKAERDRLTDMLASPADSKKHFNREAASRKNGSDIVRMLPDAMLYTYAPGQPQTGTNHGNLEVVLDFKPNPGFTPPTIQAQALTGLMGRVWIDAHSHRMVRMEGEVFQGVNFGWGMLAHVYPGGKWDIEQTNAGGQRWIFTHFSDQITVRALVLKTLNVHSDVKAFDFQTVEPMGYQDAIHVLLDAPASR